MNNLVKLSLVLNILTMILSLVLYIINESPWIAGAALMTFVSSFISIMTNMRDYEKR